MKHDPQIAAASTKESSPFYDEVILERGDYRIIVGKDTSRYPKQFIVQKYAGGRYRNLSYHLNWDSIGQRHGAWLVSPDDHKCVSVAPWRRSERGRVGYVDVR